MADRPNYDSPWKIVLDNYFPEFVAFFFPHIFNDIDWERSYEFLDKELQQIMRDAESGDRYVDKLVKVWRKSGNETWVLVHVEVQASRESQFKERMYIYNYRAFDRYERKVASLAILTDENLNWRPTYYEYDLWGSKVRLDFLVAKLLDYKGKAAELEANPNPFALVVLAHLQSLATRNWPDERLVEKLTLTQLLYERGYTSDDIYKLFRFLDWLLILPPALERKFEDKMEVFVTERKMEYVSVWERNIEKRIAERITERVTQKVTNEVTQKVTNEVTQGLLRDNVLRILTARFGDVPVYLRNGLGHVTDATMLDALLTDAVVCDSLDSFEVIFTNRLSESSDKDTSS